MFPRGGGEVPAAARHEYAICKFTVLDDGCTNEQIPSKPCSEVHIERVSAKSVAIEMCTKRTSPWRLTSMEHRPISTLGPVR